jgi:hypothetical protein
LRLNLGPGWLRLGRLGLAIGYLDGPAVAFTDQAGDDPMLLGVFPGELCGPAAVGVLRYIGHSVYSG